MRTCGANRSAQCALHSVIVWIANSNFGVPLEAKVLQNARKY
jgi:hypothetical protein